MSSTTGEILKPMFPKFYETQKRMVPYYQKEDNFEIVEFHLPDYYFYELREKNWYIRDYIVTSNQETFYSTVDIISKLSYTMSR